MYNRFLYILFVSLLISCSFSRPIDSFSESSNDSDEMLSTLKTYKPGNDSAEILNNLIALFKGMIKDNSISVQQQLGYLGNIQNKCSSESIFTSSDVSQFKQNVADTLTSILGSYKSGDADLSSISNFANTTMGFVTKFTNSLKPPSQADNNSSFSGLGRVNIGNNSHGMIGSYESSKFERNDPLYDESCLRDDSRPIAHNSTIFELFDKITKEFSKIEQELSNLGRNMTSLMKRKAKGRSNSGKEISLPNRNTNSKDLPESRSTSEASSLVKDSTNSSFTSGIPLPVDESSTVQHHSRVSLQQ